MIASDITSILGAHLTESPNNFQVDSTNTTSAISLRPGPAARSRLAFSPLVLDKHTKYKIDPVFGSKRNPQS